MDLTFERPHSRGDGASAVRIIVLVTRSRPGGTTPIRNATQQLNFVFNCITRVAGVLRVVPTRPLAAASGSVDSKTKPNEMALDVSVVCAQVAAVLSVRLCTQNESKVNGGESKSNHHRLHSRAHTLTWFVVLCQHI